MNIFKQTSAFSALRKKCFCLRLAMDDVTFMEAEFQHISNDFQGCRVHVSEQPLLRKLTTAFNSILTSRHIPLVVRFFDRYEQACHIKAYFATNLSAINQYS